MEELIELTISEQSDLCAQVRDYRKRSLTERIALAQAYRQRQLQRWDEQWEPLLNSMAMEGRTVKVQFGSSYTLIDASSRDDVDEVRALLESGANPNAVNFDGLSALHQCCIEDSEEIAETLIEFGADVNLRDNEWWTPLHAAASCGHEHLVKLLLSNGASVAALNCDGDLPIDMAETSEIFDLLKQAQTDQGLSDDDLTRQRYQLEEQMRDDLDNKRLDVESRDHIGATALHVAAAHGLTSVAEMLLKQGANSNARDQDDWTPVHAAACWGYADVLELLSQYGANFDARTKNYDTPYSLTEDEELRSIIMELKMKSQKTSLRRRSGKRLTISSRGQTIKRTTLERKKSLSRDDARREAEFRAAAEQLAQDLLAAGGSPDDMDSGTPRELSPTSLSSSGNNTSVSEGPAASSPVVSNPPVAMDSLSPPLQNIQTSEAGGNLGKMNEDELTVKPQLIVDDDDHSTSAFDLPTANGHSQDFSTKPFESGEETQPDGMYDDEPSSPVTRSSASHTSAVGLLPKEDKEKEERTKDKKCCVIL